MLASSKHPRSPNPPTSQYIEPPQSTLPSSPNNAEGDGLDEFLGFTHKPATQSAANAKLSHPVAIPQLIPGAGKPFARAYAPVLAAHGITVSDFLAFLDSLNIVSSGTPPLRILGMTGGLIGMVPWHYAQLLSIGVQAAAKAGNRVYASVRGERFMEEVNRSFFAPRGLKVSLIIGEALAQMLGVDYATMAQMAGTEGSARLITPQMRTNAMSGRIQELNFDVPPPVEPNNVLDQLSARVQEREAKKFEQKLHDGLSKPQRGSSCSSTRGSSEDATVHQLEEFAQSMQQLEQWKSSKLEDIHRSEHNESKRAKEEGKVLEEYGDKMEKLQNKQKEVTRKSQRKAERHGKSKSSKREKNSKDEKKMVEALRKLQWILIQNL